MKEWIIYFNYLQLFFWSLAYIMIIKTGIKNKKNEKMPIPTLPIILNLGWETVAVLKDIVHYIPQNILEVIGRVVWLLLDIIILMIYCYKKIIVQKKMSSAFFTVFVYMLVCIAYTYIFRLNYGMLISSFIIDLIMAFEFYLMRNTLEKDNKTLIAILKLCGDVFAWFYYSHDFILIFMIGLAVFTLNLFYLIQTIKEKTNEI